MRHIAIIGSGPAGYYTAEAAVRAFGTDVRVDIIDRMPAPFGLIRTGVAPDHQAIKDVSKRYAAIALTDNVRFVGNVTLGTHVSVAELLDLYDAVVLATGAPRDRPLDIAGGDLPGVVGSAAFVGWYNGHPDYAQLDPPLDGTDVAIIGNGNVALDVARILGKAPAEFAGSDIVAHAADALAQARTGHITIIGRRGPHQVHMAARELTELGKLTRASIRVDPDDLPPVQEDAVLETNLRKAVGFLRGFSATKGDSDRPVRILFDFFARPVAVQGDGRAERLIVERTQLDSAGEAQGTGERYAIPARLVVSCIGYRTPPIEGIPYDATLGRFANEEGRIGAGLYCVGWARRGPTGTIGTNKPDGYMIVEKIAQDVGAGSAKAGRDGLDALLASRDVEPVTFHDWQRIEAAEQARARDGAPREKFTSVDDMLGALGR